LHHCLTCDDASLEAVTVRYLGTVDLPLAGLAQFPGNARRGDIKVIRASVARHGQYRSIVVRQLEDGSHVIVAGNHTALALAAEGHETARADLIECDEGEARRINLADNRSAELGGYDDEALAALLSSLDGDFGGTGWLQEDLDALLRAEPESRNDPDDVPPVPVEPVTQPGDVWLLGPHRLLCGDATDMAAVEAMLAGDRCDCMWTDPPYGVGVVGGTSAHLTIANDTVDGLAEVLDGAFAVATAALKPEAAFYVAYPSNQRILFDAAIVRAGWTWAQELVWVKNSLVMARSDYHFRHEGIVFGYVSGVRARRGAGGSASRKPGWYGDDAQTSVFEIPKPSRSEEHPTMKPVALVAAMLANSCPPRGLVYEPFGGSGSTLIAAHGLGMEARVVELDPVYCDVICRRYAEHTGIEPVLEHRASVAV
jgi:DNA modification methylase